MQQIIDLLIFELSNFFSVSELIKLLDSGDYASLKTWSGIQAALSPLIPFILVLEIGLAFFNKNFKAKEYKVQFLIYVFNRIVGRYISFGVVAFCIGVLSPFSLFQAALTWYWFLYGYIVWEFAHFIYHFLAHKVRLFWCLHSTHHAPENMNLSVTYAHFFLEGPYADFIRTSICIFFGVPPFQPRRLCRG